MVGSQSSWLFPLVERTIEKGLLSYQSHHFEGCMSPAGSRKSSVNPLTKRKISNGNSRDRYKESNQWGERIRELVARNTKLTNTPNLLSYKTLMLANAEFCCVANTCKSWSLLFFFIGRKQTQYSVPHISLCICFLWIGSLNQFSFIANLFKDFRIRSNKINGN